MKKLLRNVFSDVTYGVSRLSSRSGGVRMLTYHRVTDAHPGDRLCVPVKNFAEQMEFLHTAGYKTVTQLQLKHWVETGAGLPSAAVAITFDDGFEDNFLYAYPELKKRNLTGCFFVPSGFIESGNDGHAPADRPMTWDQMKRMLDEGQEIGGHSVSHRKLTQINPSELHSEIAGCKDVLQQGLRRPVDFFCYPAGYYNAEVKRMVKESGYLGACTVEPGPIKPGSDPFAMKRTEVSAFDSVWDFKKKLAGAYDWLHAAVQKVNH
jgi:peptidoglycan/xylan/chitin deacetylase (PgdA/CDA1 family)